MYNAAASAVVGGTATVLGGGKFGNGAVTGAFSYLFSQATQASREPPGRALTRNEVAAAEGVFGNKIVYQRVRIVDAKFVPWQADGYVMAPDGNIYWPGECGDLATCGGERVAEVFIHEMTHVLQVQHGVSVLARGLFLQAGKFLSGYLYDPYSIHNPREPFSSYNIEQQGKIAEGIYDGVYPNNIDY